MTTLKLVTFQIECALTGDIIHAGILIESYAETLCEKARRKNPAAFVRKVEAA